MSFTSLPTLINYFAGFKLCDLRICMNIKTIPIFIAITIIFQSKTFKTHKENLKPFLNSKKLKVSKTKINEFKKSSN